MLISNCNMKYIYIEEQQNNDQIIL